MPSAASPAPELPLGRGCARAGARAAQPPWLPAVVFPTGEPEGAVAAVAVRGQVVREPPRHLWGQPGCQDRAVPALLSEPPPHPRACAAEGS